MRAAETLDTLEQHLITEDEALEQTLADDLDDLYGKAADERDRNRRWGSRPAGAAERRLHQ